MRALARIGVLCVSGLRDLSELLVSRGSFVGADELPLFHGAVCGATDRGANARSGLDNECVLLRVVSCRVVSCRVASCRIVSCRVMWCRVGSCRVMSCRVVSRPVASCRVVSCGVV